VFAVLSNRFCAGHSCWKIRHTIVRPVISVYLTMELKPPKRPKRRRSVQLLYSLVARKRSALVMTDTELKLIAAAAIMGFSSR